MQFAIVISHLSVSVTVSENTLLFDDYFVSKCKVRFYWPESKTES